MGDRLHPGQRNLGGPTPFQQPRNLTLLPPGQQPRPVGVGLTLLSLNWLATKICGGWADSPTSSPTTGISEEADSFPSMAIETSEPQQPATSLGLLPVPVSIILLAMQMWHAVTSYPPIIMYCTF